MATYNSSFNNPYPSGWKNTPEQTTPITAEALQAHTDALQAIDDYLSENPIPESGGGGTGGTTNYNELTNKPSINGVELNGNKTSEQLGISGGTDDYEELNNKPTINGVEVVGDLTAEDLGLSGGGSGTDNYNDLSNKPSIEGVELVGDKTLADFGGKKQIRISWADFQLLPTEEKEDLSIVYFIYDFPNTEYTASNIVYVDTLSNLGATNVQDAIQTVANIAKGRNQAHVFATTEDMQEWLSDSANKGLWSKGDNIYIVEIDVSDWWVAEVLEEADSETGYYYKIAQLETQKVDLTNYLPLSGGTMTGDLKTTNIYGTTPNTMAVGSTAYPYKVMRSNQFVATDAIKTYGSLSINIPGTTETTGLSILTIGNNTPIGEEGNARGLLRIHDSNYYRHDILPNDNLSGNVTQYLSSKSGILATVSLSGTKLTINL